MFSSTRDSDVVRDRRIPTLLLVSIALATAVLLFGALGPLVVAHDPYQQDLAERLSPPTHRHWLGTDELGRDVFARLAAGARVVFQLIPWTILIPVAGGLSLGLAAGLLERAGHLFNLLLDILLPLPELLMALLLASLLGPSLEHALLALSIVLTPLTAKLVRAEVLRLKHSAFVLRLRASGIGPIQLTVRHFIPHLLGSLLVQSAVNLGMGITATAGLGYLGLGAQPPAAEWGLTLNSAMPLLESHGHIAFASAFLIVMASLSFNLLGEGLQEVFLRSSEH